MTAEDQTQDEGQAEQGLTPLQLPEGHVLGKYASFPVSPEPMYGPDELGDMQKAIGDLTEFANRADSAAAILETLQAWEARLFERGYHDLETKRKGFSLYGGGSSEPAAILASADAQKRFPVNVYGARKDKVASILTRTKPPLNFGPRDGEQGPNSTAADEANQYLKIWLSNESVKKAFSRTGGLFYTDETSVLYTRAVADEQRFGTEMVNDPLTDQPTGTVPETETAPAPSQSDAPAVREVTTAHGKLERRCPIQADDIYGMSWFRLSGEVDIDILKERYPWIEDKISAGSTVGGQDQLDRLARVHVRLAVQTGTATGESWNRETTESLTWFRPSSYRSIKDKGIRQIFYSEFSKGLLVVHAGSQLAFVRNESMDDHIAILHAKDGDGQNRRSIGANYLPLQKVLNLGFGLWWKYFQSCIPRRFAAEGPVDVSALNNRGMSNMFDVIPVDSEMLAAAGGIQGLTGIENVPQPTAGLGEFVQWLIQGAPEVMDGATPAVVGEGDNGTVGEAVLNRDQALQVYSTPWAEICLGFAMAATQAVQCAAQNRKTSQIKGDVPGVGRIVVELSNLKGEAICRPETLEIPQSMAEIEARMATLIEQSPQVPLYQAIVNDPLNLPVFRQFPTFKEINLQGLDAVEKQQGEFELLLQGGPLPNPALTQAQMQMEQLTNSPEAQTPDGQQMLQQAMQAMQAIPPQVSSVPVAQDGSENHAIESVVTLALMNSAEGRKLANGDENMKSVFANLKLHWQGHEEMKAKLTPVPPLPVKANATVAIDKLPPNVQAQALQAMGVQAKPEDFETDHSLQPHEVTTEREGVDQNGVPVKQKIAMSNPNAKLN